MNYSKDEVSAVISLTFHRFLITEFLRVELYFYPYTRNSKRVSILTELFYKTGYIVVIYTESMIVLS